jgi:uncharacterized protein
MARIPVITGAYVAIFALGYIALSFLVIRYRRSVKAAFGDAGDIRLRSAIRAHAHFAEYVPLALLMIALLEIGGASAFAVHGLAILLLAARVTHPFGMFAKPGSGQFQGRVAGMAMTVTVIGLAALMLLWRAIVG